MTGTSSSVLGALGLVVALWLAAMPASAVEMYRWVDERGRTHIADVVPERYRKSAIKVDSRKFEPSEQQRGQAAAVSAAILARAASSPAPGPVPSRAVDPAGSAPVRAGSTGFGRPAASAPATAANDCETLQRQYAQAQSCFAPCVQGNGSVKAECFTRCAVLVDPSPRCGLPKLQEERRW